MTHRRMYQGGALMVSASRAVSIFAAIVAACALFVCYLWAVSLGLPNL